MSDRIHSQARRERSLRIGYQFGDAASLDQARARLSDAVERARIAVGEPIQHRWRAPYENAAERLGWNDLTRGEH